MQLTLELDIQQLPQLIKHTDKVLLTGSCFTENMSERLTTNKFKILSNPHGILFNPLSVAQSLEGYIDNKTYDKQDLFYLNELWNSWDHHTRFSHTDANEALFQINQSQNQAASFIQEADWVIITLGSAFQYYLIDTNKAVANNHRAPAQWFEKRLLEITAINEALVTMLDKLLALNPTVKILFTISPVRHIRDGVVDNNRSKARLIDVVHAMCTKYEQVYYFPAYELIIDILRDYRYYDIDFVHPNYMATSFVWEKFAASCIDNPTQQIMKQVQDIATAKAHRTRFPDTEAHSKFKESYLHKAKDIKQQFPYLDMEEELRYFSK